MEMALLGNIMFTLTLFGFLFFGVFAIQDDAGFPSWVKLINNIALGFCASGLFLCTLYQGWMLNPITGN